jgi:hypothetical protein
LLPDDERGRRGRLLDDDSLFRDSLADDNRGRSRFIVFCLLAPALYIIVTAFFDTALNPNFGAIVAAIDSLLDADVSLLVIPVRAAVVVARRARREGFAVNLFAFVDNPGAAILVPVKVVVVMLVLVLEY